MSGRVAVFGYGSLVDLDSATATLGRPVERVHPARLPGWRRRWSTCRDNRRSEKVFARVGDGSVPAWVLALDLERSARPPSTLAAAPNGALIEVDEAELHRLDQRELRYDRVEVTNQVTAAQLAGIDRVFTYTASAEHRAATPPDDAVILAAYVVAVEDAFAGLGPGELDTYRRTTAGPPVAVVDAHLVFEAIPDGNPRAW